MSQTGLVKNMDGHYENERQLNNVAPYGDQPGPAYNMSMASPGAVGYAAPTVVMMGEQPWVWNWCTIVTAVIAFFLCPLCGFTGTVFGLLSYTDHSNQRYNDARSKKNMALCCGITGIVISAIVFITIIALAASGVALVEKAVEEERRHNMDMNFG